MMQVELITQKFKTKIWLSSLRDSTDAQILIKGTIKVVEVPAADRENKR